MLLEGVVASGKTAVYAAAIDAALDAGRDALVLVPEASLALPLVDRLRHDLGVEPVLVHSGALGGRAGRRVAPAAWRDRAAGRGRVPGWPSWRPSATRASSWSTRSTTRPTSPTGRRATRHATWRSSWAGWRVHRSILGSATPDIVSVGRARQGVLAHLRLVGPCRRAARRTVDVVDLRAELAEGNRGLLSAPLVDGPARRSTREPASRRSWSSTGAGSASVVLCRDCGYVQICPECQRPLVFHAAQMALRCHHCGATAPPARRCPACGSPRIRYLGGGTERVEQEVGTRFPELRVSRLDRDVAERRGAAAAVIDDLVAGRTDVLVGTSLVTKGLDVPQVTLVGVVSADVALTLPDERAAERTWQLLAQAVGPRGAGRPAGSRHHPDLPARPSRPSGPSPTAMPARSWTAELDQRRRFGSPPFGRLVKLTVALPEHDRARGRGAAPGRRAADACRRQATGHRRPRCWDRCPRTSRAEPADGGSTSCSGVPTPWPCWAATRARPGASMWTPRACSDDRVSLPP